MSVFGQEYSSAYDHLYREKDYERECDFIESIWARQPDKVETVLDLGCGTGGHAIVLSRRGYRVTGVDRSSEMLSHARKKAAEQLVEIDYYESDIQELKLDAMFDAVIAMFAVMSYQATNSDLAEACRAARRHLKTGGVFLFDAWSGLAVLTDPPAQRVKEVVNDKERVVRLTRPHMDLLSHTVDTHFTVLKFKSDRLVSEVKEMHRMRFLFPREIAYFLEMAGFTETAFCPFLKADSPLGASHWNMAVIAK